MQFPFDNCHWPFSATTFFEIGVYRNCDQLFTQLSGRKGSVTYGLGVDISLPPYLVTGIWNLAPKPTSGPKSLGSSFGTTLWHHVRRYCCFGISLTHAQLPYNWSSFHIRGVNIHIGSTKYNTPLMWFAWASFFNKWIRISVCCWDLAWGIENK